MSYRAVLRSLRETIVEGGWELGTVGDSTGDKYIKNL